MPIDFAKRSQPTRMKQLARQKMIERGLIPRLPPLPSSKSKLAFAVEIAKRRIRQLERSKNFNRHIDPRIPTKWEDFAPLVNIQTGGTIAPFLPYDYQLDLIHTIEANQNSVICKSRQMGISETVCCWLLMRSLTEPGFSAVIFSKTQDDASRLGGRIRDMAVSLGALCPQMESDSQTRLAFRGLGKLFFLPVTARSARGIPSVSVVFFDEAAFIDDIDGVYQAAVPTLSMLGDRGKVIFNSTPNGRTGLFYRLLTAGSGESKRAIDTCKEVGEAIASGNVPTNAIAPFERLQNHTRSWQYKKWAKIFLHWRAHPIYGADPQWAEKTREDRALTEAQWNQEYELGFAEGQSNVFPHHLIERATCGMWEPPRRDRIYIAGIDPNFGGGDYFTTRIWDVTSVPYRLAAQYRENYKTKDYSIARTIELLDAYRPRQVSIESNGGQMLLHDEIQKDRPKLKLVPVNTSNTSKMQNTDRLLLLLERNQLVFATTPDDRGNPSSEEYLHFIEKIKGATRLREAEGGWHDDTVMADAIAFANFDLIPVKKPMNAPLGSVKSNRRLR